MKNSLIKFICERKKNTDYYNKHWEYCCSIKIPFICILQSGTKYWKMDFDVFPITKLERVTKINYAEHVIPLYDLYCKYADLPLDRSTYSGGGRSLVFTVHKKDATNIAEKLFDLLMLLSERDQQLFDESPIEDNKVNMS